MRFLGDCWKLWQLEGQQQKRNTGSVRFARDDNEKQTTAKASATTNAEDAKENAKVAKEDEVGGRD
jgi:hypothetical protein